MNKLIKNIKIKARHIIKEIVKKQKQREIRRQRRAVIKKTGKFTENIKMKIRNIFLAMIGKLKQINVKRQGADIKKPRGVRKETPAIFSAILSKTKSAFGFVAVKIKSTFKFIMSKIKGEDTNIELGGQPMPRSDKNRFNFGEWIKSKRGIISICSVALIIIVPLVILSIFGPRTAQDQMVADETPETDISAGSESNVLSLNEMFSGIDTLSVINTASQIERNDIKPGIASKYVVELQEKLMELGYMDDDEPTEYYGPMTKQAVTLFQREHFLTMDGCAGEKTWEILLSGNAKPYAVYLGVEGTDVSELQSRLRELGYTGTVNGKFGTETEAAVKKFQQLNGLPADGKIGEQTREKLYSEDVKANAISYGEESDLVRTYQQRLKALGYLTFEPDGKFGADTVAAVKKFQADNGIIADGYVGPTTKEALMSPNAEANVLKLGDKGDEVTKVQNRLKSLNYLSAKNVTGYYGSATESAVKAFQKRNSLNADGKIGAVSMAKLFASSAKKAAVSGSSGKAASASADVSKVQQLINIAKSKLGYSYVWGAKGPNSFDCSGYVYWCLNQVGLRQGYLTSYGWRSSTRYPKITSFGGIQAGDVIVFEGHVGLAIGGGMMINASSSRGEVVISSLGQNYWREHFICAFRVL